MICMQGPPFWGRIKFIQTAPRMALERLNMHRKKVKNAVWLGVVGAIWCRFDLVENTSGLVLSIRLVEEARLDLVQTYRGLRVS